MRASEFLNESVQSYNQLDNDEIYQKCLDSWTDYYGNEETARSELGNYNYEVSQLHKRGGKLWRVIFADSPDEVNMDIGKAGNSWTTDSSNISDYVDQNWEYYGKGKKHVYVIEAIIGPNNVSNNLVDVSGNPHEKEVNIINPAQATYKLYNYSGKQIGQRIRENMDHSKDDQAVPQLKAALLAQKKKIQSVQLDKDAVYDIIDGMMTSVAKAHGISGQRLHDMWTAKYKEIPDTWILHQ